MTIVRILVVDPLDEESIVVFQVPENSRQLALIEAAFQTIDYDFVTLEPSKRKKELQDEPPEQDKEPESPDE